MTQEIFIAFYFEHCIHQHVHCKRYNLYSLFVVDKFQYTIATFTCELEGLKSFKSLAVDHDLTAQVRLKPAAVSDE